METEQTEKPNLKVWLKDERKTAVVRKVESHPVWGKQYLVTTHSDEWGPETFWVKEENVENYGGRHD